MKPESILRLALQLEPNESAIILPLALNCYYMGRYVDAIPLFERGIPPLGRRPTPIPSARRQ